ncbi:type II toxin-antitoxin system VapC family toxin [Verrucomicrobiota bacterium]
MKTYLDSSAFAKRFVDEAGSDKVEDACAQASELGLSVICVPEIVSALNRRRRERGLTKHQYAEAKRCLIDDVRDANIINLTVPVIGSVITVLETSPIRAMDALHIACALEWGAQIFVSSDKKQLTAAKRAGMTTHKV